MRAQRQETGWRRPAWRIAGTVAVVAALGLPTVARAEIIDRVLAVVGDHIITLSDARAALRLSLVPPDVSEDPIAPVLQRLIDRRLILTEVERYGPAEPAPAAIDLAVAGVQRRFGDAASFEAALNETGMSRDELRRYVRDTLRIDNYLQQRFTSVIEPSSEEVAAYYAAHPEAYPVDGVTQPLERVRERIVARMLEERHAAAIREWLDSLRRRTSIMVLYLRRR